MNILLAIKPKYIEKILAKEKFYEFRKIIPKHNIDKIYVYASYSISKIVGEFTTNKILCGNKDDIWSWCEMHAGISKNQFYSYFQLKDIAYAIEINNFIKYNNYINLKDLNLKAPQNFYYLNNDHIQIINKILFNK